MRSATYSENLNSSHIAIKLYPGRFDKSLTSHRLGQAVTGIYSAHSLTAKVLQHRQHLSLELD